MFSDHFDVLILNIILKNIILIYFKIKNILKNNHYSTFNQPYLRVVNNYNIVTKSNAMIHDF
jgi:hypothetical protein